MSVRTAVRLGVATLTLDSPERRNALNGDSARAFAAALDEVTAKSDIGAVVVTGTPPAFCAGADREVLARAGDANDDDARRDLEAIYDAFLSLGRSPVPTVAAVNGAAVGAGLNLALAADVCVVARDAMLVSGFMRIDLHPGGGHHLLLRRRAGLVAANAIALFDAGIDGQRAAEVGLAWRAVDAGDVLSTAQEIAAIPGAKPELARLMTRTVRRAAEDSSWLASVEAERGAQLTSLLWRSRAPDGRSA